MKRFFNQTSLLFAHFKTFWRPACIYDESGTEVVVLNQIFTDRGFNRLFIGLG
jgi:hypothetical protein